MLRRKHKPDYDEIARLEVELGFREPEKPKAGKTIYLNASMGKTQNYQQEHYRGVLASQAKMQLKAMGYWPMGSAASASFGQIFREQPQGPALRPTRTRYTSFRSGQ